MLAAACSVLTAEDGAALPFPCFDTVAIDVFVGMIFFAHPTPQAEDGFDVVRESLMNAALAPGGDQMDTAEEVRLAQRSVMPVRGTCPLTEKVVFCEHRRRCSVCSTTFACRLSRAPHPWGFLVALGLSFCCTSYRLFPSCTPSSWTRTSASSSLGCPLCWTRSKICWSRRSRVEVTHRCQTWFAPVRA